MGKVQKQTDYHFLVSPISLDLLFIILKVNLQLVLEKVQWERIRMELSEEKGNIMWYTNELINLSHFFSATHDLLIISFILEATSKQTRQQGL